MRILAIGGSPRLKGNSNSLLRIAIEGAVERGASADVLIARNLSIQGCLGCDGCKRKRAQTCVVKDDMHEVYALLKKCDVLLLATPVYYYGMSSWLKEVIDRLYGLLGPRIPGPLPAYERRVEAGKGYYVITTEEESHPYDGQVIVANLMRALGWLEMELKGELLAVEVSGANDWKKRPELIQAARDLISVS